MTLNSTNYRCLLSKKIPIIIYYSWMTLNCMLKQHELQSLVHTFRIILKYIGMKFEMDKYSTVRIKKRKICDVVDVEMPDELRM